MLLSGIVSVAAGLGGCSLAVRGSPSAGDSLAAQLNLDGVVGRAWQYLQVNRPDLAVQAGLPAAGLPDVSIEREKVDAQFARSILLSLDAIRVAALTEDEYVTWQTLRWDMEQLAGWPAFHWTRLTDLSPGRSVLDDAVEAIQAHGIREAGDREWHLGLLRAMPVLCRALRAEFEERASRGIRPSRVALLRSASHVRAFIAPPEASPFSLVDTLPGAREGASEAATAMIALQVNPSLDSLASFLEAQVSSSPEESPLGALPGGREHFAAMLRFHSTLDVSPEQAHSIGLRETARLAQALDSAQRAGGGGNRDSLLAARGDAPRWRIEDPAALPELAAGLFASISSTLDSLFGPTPAGRLSIGLMAAATDSPVTRYRAPTAHHDARYRLNAARLSAHGADELTAFVVADLMPGLHRQQATQRENEALPAFRRLAAHGGFVSGWRTYALAMAESALPSLSVAERSALRQHELAAACGLVVDTGIHAFGWTRGRSLAFLRECLPWPDDELEREFIVESIESPGRLSAAALGARELHGLRRWAERELGPRFNLGAFHRELLRVGSVPLPVLGAHLEHWIWEQASAVGRPR